MRIEGEGAERVAKDLIRDIASEWVDVPNARCVEENGSYVFEFTLKPSVQVRRAHQVERPLAVSTFRFNPLAEATEIVIEVAFILLLSRGNPNDAFDPTTAESIVRDKSKPHIRQMLELVPAIFTDAMTQARIVGGTLPEVKSAQESGRPDIARGLINSALAMIDKKAREHFPRIPQKQKPKISTVIVLKTLLEFLPEFKTMGQIPSQRQFAKKLGVTPKAWRDYIDKNKLGDSFVKRALEFLLTSEE